MNNDQQVASVNPEWEWTLKWWAFKGEFPLVPIIRQKPADKFNTASFSFTWLGFRLWTIDSPAFGFEFEISDYHTGIKFRLPYLIFGFWIPMPEFIRHRFWRMPPTKETSNEHE